MIIDQQLKTIYEKASYEIIKPKIQIIPNQENEALNTLLIDNATDQWALITAYNPHSQMLKDQENITAHQKLIKSIESSNWPWIPAINRDLKSLWPDEPGCFILGIGKIEALKLSRMFRQNAILYGRLGENAELIWV